MDTAATRMITTTDDAAFLKSTLPSSLGVFLKRMIIANTNTAAPAPIMMRLFTEK